MLLTADEYRRLKYFGDREVYLARELPAEWVAELEKPVPPYKTELDHLVEPRHHDPGGVVRVADVQHLASAIAPECACSQKPR